MNIGPEAEQAELVLYYFYLFLSYLITFLQDPVLKKLFGLNFSGTGEPEERLQEPQGSSICNEETNVEEELEEEEGEIREHNEKKVSSPHYNNS